MEIPLVLLSLKPGNTCLLLREHLRSGSTSPLFRVLPGHPLEPNSASTLCPPWLVRSWPCENQTSKGSSSKGYFHIKCLPPVLSHWGESFS